MLGAHVLYLCKLQRTVLLRLVERVAGDVGMDVNLEGLVILADDQRVAYAVEVGAQRVEIDVGVVLADDVHRVEREGDVLGVEHLERGLFLDLSLRLCGAHGSRDLAAQGGEHRLEYRHKAHAARVHNSGLLQHGVEVHGVLQRLFARSDRALERAFKACARVRGLYGCGGGKAGNGEYGALRGLHNCLVCRVHAVGQRAGEFRRACGLDALEAAGYPAEQQRQDNAGVAARAAQQRGCDAGGRGVDCVEALFPQLGGGAVHGKAHVGAGIAVGDGENVKIVDYLNIVAERGVRAEHHFLERRSVNIFSQVKHLRGKLAYPIIVSI